MSVFVVLALIAVAPLQDALAEGHSGIAARFPGDRGIARDAAVLFHDDFEAGMPQEKWSSTFHLEQIRMATESENVHAGKRALEFRVPKQEAELSNAVVKRFEKGYDTLFLRYYSRFDGGFDQIGSSHNGGYLAAISAGLPYATPGIKADGRNKFVASLENWRDSDAKPSPGELNVYCYHPEQRSEWGDHFFPSGVVLPFTYKPGEFGPSFVKRPEVIQKLGRWACYELMLSANTPDKRDGRIGCWIDGKLVADFPNLRLRDVESLKINFAALDLHIHGNSRRENKKWYDDIVIATSYIGPMVL